MKRILDFTGFINEGFIGTHSAFIFVPVDKNFKSVDKNLSTSDTKFPSELLGTGGVAGYVLVPCTVETSQFINSPHFKSETPEVKGGISYSRSANQDGYTVMNSPADMVSGSLTGKASIFSEIPGFGQNVAFYFKSGNALILEILMKKQGWDEEVVKNIRKKIANGFETNKALQFSFYGGMDFQIETIKKLFAASSEDIGLKFANPKEMQEPEFDVTQELLDLFNQKPGDFVALNFSEGVFDMISNLAKEKGTENVAQTIDNLGDLKSAGFLED